MELGSENVAAPPARSSQGVPSVAHRTDRLSWSRGSVSILLNHQRHGLSHARSRRAAARCSRPWTSSLSSEAPAAAAAAQGCPDGLLDGRWRRPLPNSHPTLFRRACHDMALLGAISSRKHPAG